MKNVLRIFTSDLKRLVTNVFALVIAIGLCALPSLYAWFNIYSNWDPYANTANIRVAVSTQDQGYTDDNGRKQNMGDDIIKQLRENKKIGWVFTDSTDALNGVYDGRYYAAVIIGPDFTESMVNVFKEDFKEPTIIYYENEKKNAVATKITDTAVSTLKQSINEKFIEVLASSLFSETNQLTQQIESDGGMDALTGQLTRLSDNLKNYRNVINTFLKANQALEQAVNQADSSLSGVHSDIAAGKTDVATAQQKLSELDQQGTSAKQFTENVRTYTDQIRNSMTALQNDIQAILNSEDVQAARSAALNAAVAAAQLQQQVTGLSDALGNIAADENTPQEAKDLINKIQGTLSGISDNTSGIQDALKNAGVDTDAISKAVTNQTGVSASDLQAALNSVSSGDVQAYLSSPKTLDAMKNAVGTASAAMDALQTRYTQELQPQAQQAETELKNVLQSVNSLFDGLDKLTTDTGTLFSGVQDTVDSTDASLTEMEGVLDRAGTRLSTLLDQMSGLSSDEKVQMLWNLLKSDPKTYGEFFAQPVDVNTMEVYPIANYGSAMTPFYSVLAIWVGALILTALIKVKAEKERYLRAPGDGITQTQLFFGRYLLFFVMGQLQALIIVLGDIYLLHCQILDPFRFWFAAAVTSFVFTLLVYALTISFGDIGKAVAVVVMVIQIAGSGGTYPIELLPDVYRNIYIFFPFPYAINAMRETIGGRYGNTYALNLLYLLIFAGAALLIGLVIRKPFIGLNHFMEKRMEDTKLM